MTSYSVAELQDGQRLSNRLILDKHFVVLDNNIPFSKALQKRLVEWGFKTLYSEEDAPVSKAEPEKTPVENAAPKKAEEVAAEKPAPKSFETVDLDLETLNEQYKDKSNGLNFELKEVLAKVNLSIKDFPNKNRMENVTEAYNAFVKYTQLLFTRYVTHRK